MGDFKKALDVLQGLLENGKTPLSEDFKRYRLKLDWSLVVGAAISEKCSPVAYSHGVLYVWVINSTWMNQLFFVRSEILKKVNGYNGAKWAREIRFTQDKKDIPPEAQL
jgi:predicted nucleic acid-binding Zn ribbon protein